MWYGIILLLGLVLLAVGIYKFNETLKFIKNNERVPATVVELDSYKDSEGDIVYRPVFQYKVGREERKFVYRVASKPPAWQIGEEAHLVIVRGDPEKTRVLTYFGAFGWTVVLVAISLPLIFMGAGYFWANSFFKKLIA